MYNLLKIKHIVVIIYLATMILIDYLLINEIIVSKPDLYVLFRLYISLIGLISFVGIILVYEILHKGHSSLLYPHFIFWIMVIIVIIMKFSEEIINVYNPDNIMLIVIFLLIAFYVALCLWLKKEKANKY